MLHGEIKVNNYDIARWSAVRKGYVNASNDRSLPDGDLDRYYRCKVDYEDLSGNVWTSDFYVEHPYNAGAFVLVSKIMTAYYEHRVQVVDIPD